MRNGTLDAAFCSFAGNVIEDGSSPHRSLKMASAGLDVFVVGDSSDGGNNTSPRANNPYVSLVDTILGSTDGHGMNDFAYAVNAGGSAPDFGACNHNLVAQNGGSNGLGGTANLTGNPQFATAVPWNNGGPTQTFALLASSPALGAGVTADYPGANVPIAFDQRGLTRNNYVPIDIGAYQTQAATTATGVTSSSANNTSTYGTA